MEHNADLTAPAELPENQVESLEDLDAQDNWGDFWSGVAVGVGLVGLGVAVAT